MWSAKRVPLLLLAVLLGRPAAGAIARLSEPIMGPAVSAQSRPAIASNGSEWLVVWQEGRQLPPRAGSNGIYRTGIAGARLNTAGEVIDTVPIVIHETTAERPVLTWSRDRYVVAYIDTDLRDDAVSVYLAAVSASGTRITRPLLLTSGSNWLELLTSSQPSIAGNETSVAVSVRRADSWTDIHLLTPDLRKIATVTLPAEKAFGVTLAANGDGYLATWVDPEGWLYSMTIDNSGSDGDVHTIAANVSFAASAAAAERFEVAYVRDAALFSTTLAANGAPAETRLVRVSGQALSSEPRMIRFRGEWMLTWTDYDIERFPNALNAFYAAARSDGENAWRVEQFDYPLPLRGYPLDAWPVAASRDRVLNVTSDAEVPLYQDVLVSEVSLTGFGAPSPVALSGADQILIGAFTVDGGDVLIVWRERSFRRGWVVRATRVTPFGFHESMYGREIAQSAFHTAAATDGSRLLLIKETLNGSVLVATVYALDGTLIEGPAEIARLRGYPDNLMAGWDGSKWVACWLSDNDRWIEGVRFDTKVIDTFSHDLIPVGKKAGQTWPGLACRAGGCLVAWVQEAGHQLPTGALYLHADVPASRAQFFAPRILSERFSVSGVADGFSIVWASFRGSGLEVYEPASRQLEFRRSLSLPPIPGFSLFAASSPNGLSIVSDRTTQPPTDWTPYQPTYTVIRIKPDGRSFDTNTIDGTAGTAVAIVHLEGRERLITTRTMQDSSTMLFIAPLPHPRLDDPRRMESPLRE